jgi:DNA polymerase-3 subunit beta
MKFICSEKQLAAAVNIVQKAASNKTTLPILKGILIEANNDYLRLVGNNLDIAIENEIEAEVLENGSVVISSRLFGDIIRKLPDADITLSTDGDNNVHISCEGSNFDLIGQPAEEFPSLPEVMDENVYTFDKNVFKNMVRQTAFAASIDETRPILTGELIEIDEGRASIVALDGYRLAIKEVMVEGSKKNKAVVPVQTLNEIMKIIGNESEGFVLVSFSENHVLFTIEGVRITSRLLDGDFINYKQIIPNEYKTRVKVQTKGFLDGLERASLLAREGKNNLIKISIKDEIMKINSNAEIGSVEEKVAIELEGEDMQIGFNSKYLIDALRVLDCDDVYLDLTTSVNPCIIRPIGQNDYTYLVLPVRLSAE